MCRKDNRPATAQYLPFEQSRARAHSDNRIFYILFFFPVFSLARELPWRRYEQVFGTTELPDKPIMLPPFVDSTHCLPYYLTRKGRAVADRVVSVLAYVCPDITYSPTIYPIAAILLHFMSGMCHAGHVRNVATSGPVYIFVVFFLAFRRSFLAGWLA